MSTSDNRDTSAAFEASQTSQTFKIEEPCKITLRMTCDQNGTFSVDSVVFRSREDVHADYAEESIISGELSLEEQYGADTMTLTPKDGKGTHVFDKMPGSFQDRCRDRWKDEESIAVAKVEVSNLEYLTLQSSGGENRAWRVKGSAVCEIQGEKLPHTAGAWQLL